MIDRPPEVVSFAIDPDENFVQMPAPLDMGRGCIRGRRFIARYFGILRQGGVRGKQTG